MSQGARRKYGAIYCIHEGQLNAAVHDAVESEPHEGELVFGRGILGENETRA